MKVLQFIVEVPEGDHGRGAVRASGRAATAAGRRGGRGQRPEPGGQVLLRARTAPPPAAAAQGRPAGARHAPARHQSWPSQQVGRVASHWEITTYRISLQVSGTIYFYSLCPIRRKCARTSNATFAEVINVVGERKQRQANRPQPSV